MKKIAVIFQGIGYNSDRPLLYYSKKIAMQHGYEIAEVRFHGMDKSMLKDRKAVLEAFAAASGQAEESLAHIDFSGYKDIIFVSKSIGTVAASVYASRRQIPARQVYFTPLEQTFSLVEENNGLVFFGDKDPLIEPARIEELCRQKNLEFRIFHEANHSLETGDLQKDLKNMVDIIEETENFLVGSPVYSFSARKWDGSHVELSEYRGKVLLIVNTATGCGFTPQYKALEAMYEKYRKDGFEILDFPCDQFGHQAPESDAQIHAFCTAQYDATFPQFAKIDVNGAEESPLFAYLKSRQGFRGFLRNSPESLYMAKMAEEMDPDYQHNNRIKWNFTKFLVDRKGKVIDRFEPDQGTDIVEQAVVRTLQG